MRTLIKAFAMLACAGLAQAASAQEYPAKPIKLVVPFAAGGPADLQARWLGTKMAAVLGQPVVIENKGGAGGILGTQAVATAPADGYTLLFSSVGAIAIAPYIAEKVPYNPKEDLVPVARVATAPTVLVTASGSRHQNLASLVSYAKSNPGRVSFASAGPGTTTQLGSELLKREAGIDMIHVPYKGASPALTDVMAGMADIMFADAPVVLPFIKAGKLRALAIGTPQRESALADVPTTTEAGYKGVLVSTWYGLLAPAKTPPAAIAKINRAVNTVIASAEAKTFFAAQGLQSNGGSPEEFGAFIQSESTRWTGLAKAAGVKME
ncbi:MAG TPA: tripartite tricarboxylate transporter substrate binding protein [Ramlibacter sp.]|nr:tripartite tricarboxylate transporter substrate binding protein [Ramlibacter sp.]